MKKNVLLAQSGGPTAVINSSISGALQATMDNPEIDKVYAAQGGIEGVLAEELIELSSFDTETLKRFRVTPSSGLHSCRHNLPEDFSDAEYKRIFEVFDAHNIGYFFYNGGNDSMDTAAKLNKYAELNGIDIKVSGIAKTIDNDLFGTDHCPGFGSAAKYLNISLQEACYDTYSYLNSKTVIIMETMGRNAGWLAGSASLAEYRGKQIADLIYLPETTFDIDRFLSDVSNTLDRQNMVFAVVSEGIRGKDGSPYFSSLVNTQDKFGHCQLGGVGAMLSSAVKENIIKRVKTENSDIAQRCAAHVLSKTDFEEAYKAGYMSVKFAFEGISGVMAAFERTSNDPYNVNIVPVKLENAANFEKKIPLEWINDSGNNVNEKFKSYALPLIQGEVQIPYSNGLPDYVVLEGNRVDKKLKNFKK